MSQKTEVDTFKNNLESVTIQSTEKYSVLDLNSDPLDDREPDDGIPFQFTWRGSIIGSLLGSIIAASNMYLGLKSGWSFGASMFGSILGFAIIKPMERFPSYLGGGPFGMKENCTVQTAASASGGLSAGFVTAIPALFRLGILTNIDGIWDMMFLWTIAAAFYGLFFAIPLRKYFIIQKKLIFPSPTAAAETIRALHNASKSDNNEVNNTPGKNSAKVIIWSFIGSFVYKVVGYFIPFIIDLHPLYWIGNAANSQVLKDISTTWNWHIQITTAFIGTGMMMGTNTALSITFGNIFGWAIISPVLFFYTDGIVNKVSPLGYKIGDDGTITSQMWLMWLGIVIMICASFTELACQYKAVINGFKCAFLSIYNLFAKLTGRSQKSIESGYDPVPEHDQIPGWQWSTGLFISVIFTILILQFYFSIQWYLGLLSIIIGFLLSIVNTQCNGETNMNPTGVIGKATQFIFAPIKQSSITLDLQTNLIAGCVAATCANQTVEMVGDLKTGHLLRASPKSQFYSQIVGSLFGIVVAVVIFWIFGKAYPCILVNPDGTNSCPFPAPSVISWQGVAVALTTNILKSVPSSCQIACLIFGLATIFSTILKRTYLKKYENWIPNMNAFGIALINPYPSILLACLYGLIIDLIWKKYRPEQNKHYSIPLASGLIAGEGIGGIIYAIFQISGMNQKKLSTNFACPPTGCS